MSWRWLVGEVLLSVNELIVRYPTRRGRQSPNAVDGVSFEIAPGETLGLVGESGSGKTTIGRAILGLAPVTAGSIAFEGREITALSSRARRSMSADIQIVYQDPYGSMNPTHTVGEILTEPLRNGVTRVDGDPKRRVADMLDRVGLPASAAQRYPAQFSGGQRQRIAIARALMLSPKLVICDEPVSALDLSVQAQVLNLFRELQRDLGVAYLFIAHDLDVVRHVSHRIAVLYRGQIMEEGAATDVHGAPSHPYTRALHNAAPVPDPQEQAARRAARLQLDVQPVSPVGAHCPFVGRCAERIGLCTTTRPAPVAIGARSVACHVVAPSTTGGATA